jgi:SAM-dependent methyltransferase
MSRVRMILAERTLRQIIATVIENGPFRLLRKLVALWLDERFDRKYKVNTAGSARLESLRIDSNNRDAGVVYDPMPEKTFNGLLKSLPPVDLREYVFLDFGSGKGRTLLIASSYNFRRIVGVEFAEELHHIALSNIASYKNEDQLCTEIQSVHIDAVLFDIPIEKAILYFFVPFSHRVLSQVLRNVKRSYLSHPRKLFVLYATVPAVHPIPYRMFEDAGFLRKLPVRTLPFDLARRWPLEYVVYETG